MYIEKSGFSLVALVALMVGLSSACFIVGAAAETNSSLIEKEYDAADVAFKTPTKILELRGFKHEVHYARTRDGYNIHLVRVVNPLIDRSQLKRPVIFNHGLLESSTIWLINSHGVSAKPLEDSCEEIKFTNATIEARNGPMLLANRGFDVWLMSMRGTEFSLRHDSLTNRHQKFWDYSLDDFALGDVPSIVNYVREYTGSHKVAYVGHSQATFSVFGLLSIRPQYAQIIEPVIAVAPVTFIGNSTTIARPGFLAALLSGNAHAPWPPAAKLLRKGLKDFCMGFKSSFNLGICQLSELLVGGKGRSWPAGYFSHMPFSTSLKVLRHFGQLVKTGRYMMYDYGPKENQRIYNSKLSPDYPVANIKSRSIVLFRTKTDAFGAQADENRFIKELKVPLYRDVFIGKDFNHFDLITDIEAGKVVFKPMLEILETFERETGICREDEADSADEQ